MLIVRQSEHGMSERNQVFYDVFVLILVKYYNIYFLLVQDHRAIKTMENHNLPYDNRARQVWFKIICYTNISNIYL